MCTSYKAVSIFFMHSNIKPTIDMGIYRISDVIKHLEFVFT